MILLFLMMPLMSLSQNIQIKRTALISMMKESQKCDSLRVAYNQKTTLLNNFIDTNLVMFDEIEKHRKEQAKLQKKVDEINAKNQKLAKRNKNVIPYVLSGTAAGIIAGVLIAK